MNAPTNAPTNAVATSIYLDSCLAPLAPFLARDEVTDLYINRPGELWTETRGGQSERHVLPVLTRAFLLRFARQVAAISAQGVNREHPLLAASLPGGERVQVIVPPATRGEVAIAIRKHGAAAMTLEDYAASGAFRETRIDRAGERASPRRNGEWSTATGDLTALLRDGVRQRRNILVSGGTSTGKTTFLNSLLQEIPQEERLVVIEDTTELRIVHDNAVGLIAARGALGEAEVTAEDLLIAALRMRPDRIILGETRARKPPRSCVRSTPGIPARSARFTPIRPKARSTSWRCWCSRPGCA